MGASHRLAIAGGGVIGLSIAWRAARQGYDVVLIDPQPGHGAGWVAAGMLAPISEAHFGEESLVEIMCMGADRWPAFAAELEWATGRSVGFRSSGTLLVAVDRADRADLEREIAFRCSLGLSVDMLALDELASIEPTLSPRLQAGARIGGDHQVDNRAVLAALLEVVKDEGVELIAETIVGVSGGEAGAQVTLADGTTIDADDVVLALGAHTARLEGADALGLPSIRPVKGHVLRLKSDLPLLTHTVRAKVRGRAVYLVPRASGELVVGATVEERGFNTDIQAGEVFALLDDARRVLPGVDELQLVESSAGLRPGSADNAPTIGWTSAPHIAVATGHYRNGILLAPLTAEIVMSLLVDEAHPGFDVLAAAHRETP